MPVPRVLRIALTELAFAAGLVGLVAGGIGLMQRSAPQQLQALCLSAQAMAQGLPLRWRCDDATSDGPQGQPIQR